MGFILLVSAIFLALTTTYLINIWFLPRISQSLELTWLFHGNKGLVHSMTINIARINYARNFKCMGEWMGAWMHTHGAVAH